ncbi:MAG TPA: nodulation protein NfeD [Bryobacteraceae bacterium]|nr:nodulation protein NfeD [Bryobacteraceae bacterium]
MAAMAALLCAAPLPARVVEADIDRVVHPVTVRVISSAIAMAEREHADALLIRLNTPGGFMEATRGVVGQVFHSPVPVIMWTGPSGARAASAGFFLLESGDIAAMAPGTHTGAAHPVLVGGEMEPVIKSKLENDAAALMRTITTHRGRNQQAAEKAVRESASYTDAEALDLHLIDLIAADPTSLIQQLEGRQVTRFDGRREVLHFNTTAIDVYQPSADQRLLLAIADPNIAVMLLVLGLLGIYMEFSSPGLVAPGVAGAILVLLGLTALSMLPISWLGATLTFIGLLFFILEAKFATHGILTAGGALALAIGAVMLVNPEVPELRVHWSTALGLTIPFALITSFLLSIAVRARRSKIVTGVERMIGEPGVTVGELDSSGTILVRGEYWSAHSAGRVAAGERVRITGIDGLTLQVEPIVVEQDVVQRNEEAR